MRTPRTGFLLATALLGAALLGPVGAAAAEEFADLEIVPGSAAPGATITVNTTACGRDGTADGDATTVGGGRFRLAPTTHKEDVVGQFRVAPDTPPGTYAIGATCTNGKFATGDLTVTGREQPPDRSGTGREHPGDRPGEHPGTGREPRGHVATGVGGGTTTESNPVKIAAGAALLAVAAVGGVRVLRRRASGTRT
ncbi:hypothetical protein [Streptomyces sp. NPDC089919]|uniref:hypothetical protein n=1 Tax=Streptomyces sp. NPDC089919 TaxID=3155188 RepID=UPI00343D781F